ncbi:MAG: hypothetical protein LBS35_05525 [Synergistaceae bacterium]|nr:hypothetical protein [Synergistaceae bacterium]
MKKYIAAALAFAVMTACASPVAGISLEDAHDSGKVWMYVAAYAAQIGILAADIAVANIWKAAEQEIDDTNKIIAATKHANYATDHYGLTGANRVKADATAYINRSVGGGAGAYDARFPGYASISPAKPHTDVYKERAEAWRARMKKITDDNNYAVSDIIAAHRDVNTMFLAAKGAYGYTRQLQTGAQIVNYMNAELSKLAVDMDRRLDAAAESAMNDQRESAEEMAAFASAVGAWNAPGGADYR